jgi:hypothetical protein
VPLTYDKGAAAVLKGAAACGKVSLAVKGAAACGRCLLFCDKGAASIVGLTSLFAVGITLYAIYLSHRVSLLGFCVLGSIYLNSGGMKVLSNGGYRSLIDLNQIFN